MGLGRLEPLGEGRAGGAGGQTVRKQIFDVTFRCDTAHAIGTIIQAIGNNPGITFRGARAVDQSDAPANGGDADRQQKRKVGGRPLREIIMEWMQARGGRAKSAEIKKYTTDLGYDRDSWSGRISELVAEGRLKNVGRGVYQVTKCPSEDIAAAGPA